MKKSLAIVIVNWNGLAFLEPCLKALHGQSFKGWRLIVVDNASTDGSIEFLERHKDIELIQNSTNRGFAPANNQGFKLALEESDTKYVMALNNDTIPGPDFLQALMTQAEKSDSRVGSWQGKVLSASTPRLIDSVGIEVYPNLVAAQIGTNVIDDGQYLAGDIYGVNAAAGLYSRALIEDISIGDDFFDSDFFAYLEDVDVAMRARSKGWQAHYVPEATILHIGSATSGRESAFQWRITSRNRLLLIIKNCTLKQILQNLGPMIEADLRFSLGFLSQARPELFRAYTLGRLQALTLLPRMLVKRRQILAERTNNNLFAPKPELLPPATDKSPLAVVIPNWNGQKYLEACLSSLRQQSIKNLQVIVVDNGSTDDSITYIKKEFPEVITVERGYNSGFAAGVNRGIQTSTAKYIALLNNDTNVDKDWAKHLIAAMDNYDIAASLIMRASDHSVLDSYGDTLSKWGLPHPGGRDLNVEAAPKTETDIFAASGCSSIFKREVFENIGLFDAEFFAYYEDVDFSYRARLAGYKIGLAPASKVYHHIGATSGSLGHFARYHLLKNSHYLFYKDFPLALLLKTLPRFLLIQLLLFGAALKHGAGLVALKAYLRVCLYSPLLLYKRRQVQRKRVVTSTEVETWLTDAWPLGKGK